MVSPCIIWIPLYPSVLLFTTSLYVYMDPKNLASLWFLVYCQPSRHVCNSNIGEWERFAIVATEKIKTPRHLPVEPLLPPQPPPSPRCEQWCIFVFFLGCTEQEQNTFLNYIKIKSPQQVNPGKISWNEPSNPQHKNWIFNPPPSILINRPIICISN